VPFSFVENYFTPNQFDRFYTVNMSEEESVSPNRRGKGGASSEKKIHQQKVFNFPKPILSHTKPHFHEKYILEI
jgi:hypothetical protein